MASRRLLAAGALALAFSMTSECQADELGFRFKVGEKVGAFTLTDLTVATLLQSGYNIVSISDEIENSIAGQTITTVTAIFLQRGTSLYRCAEEPPLYKHVYCLKFDPEPAKIGDIVQQDTILNPLIGEWVGSIKIQSNLSISVKLQFSDLETDRTLKITTSGVNGAPSNDQNVSVQYYEIISSKTIVHFTPQGNMAFNINTYEFQSITDNQIAWVNTPYDHRTVLFVKNSTPTGPGPAGAMK